MVLEPVSPRGTFHARSTRDAVALDRDGQTFVLIHELTDATKRNPAVEIMFEDGEWMLAAPSDLDLL